MLEGYVVSAYFFGLLQPEATGRVFDIHRVRVVPIRVLQDDEAIGHARVCARTVRDDLDRDARELLHGVDQALQLRAHGRLATELVTNALRAAARLAATTRHTWRHDDTPVHLGV